MDNGPVFLQTIPIQSQKILRFFQSQSCWLCFSAFSSKMISHEVYIVKTHFVKIQSQNLAHNHKLLIAPKISFQMILKMSSQKWFRFSLNFFESEKVSKFWDRIGIVCRKTGPIAISFESTIGLKIKQLIKLAFQNCRL